MSDQTLIECLGVRWRAGGSLPWSASCCASVRSTSPCGRPRTKLEDGVLWQERPEGVTAADVAVRGGAMAAGIQPGDVLVAIDGAAVEKRPGRSTFAQPREGVGIALLHRAAPRRTTNAQRPGRSRSRRTDHALCDRRGDRHLHAAGRRFGASAPLERSRHPAFLLAVSGVLRHVDLFFQPPRSLGLVVLLGGCRGDAPPWAAVPALHPGVSRPPFFMGSRPGPPARRAVVCAAGRAVCGQRNRSRPPFFEYCALLTGPDPARSNSSRYISRCS